MEGWKDGRMEEWKDGRMEEWKDGAWEYWNIAPATLWVLKQMTNRSCYRYGRNSGICGSVSFSVCGSIFGFAV
jgi:hypothetical protein